MSKHWEKIKRYLEKNGPSHCVDIWRDLKIPRGSIYPILRKGPFSQLPDSRWQNESQTK